MTPERVRQAARRLWRKARHGSTRKPGRHARPPLAIEAPRAAPESAEPKSWQAADVTALDLAPITGGRPYAEPEPDPVASVRLFYARHAAPSTWRLARRAL